MDVNENAMQPTTPGQGLRAMVLDGASNPGGNASSPHGDGGDVSASSFSGQRGEHADKMAVAGIRLGTTFLLKVGASRLMGIHSFFKSFLFLIFLLCALLPWNSLVGEAVTVQNPDRRQVTLLTGLNIPPCVAELPSRPPLSPGGHGAVAPGDGEPHERLGPGQPHLPADGHRGGAGCCPGGRLAGQVPRHVPVALGPRPLWPPHRCLAGDRL
eukprot:scaffold49541_cov39-Prasinocladus_malaysianus.AAC.3